LFVSVLLKSESIRGGSGSIPEAGKAAEFQTFATAVLMTLASDNNPACSRDANAATVGETAGSEDASGADPNTTAASEENNPRGETERCEICLQSDPEEELLNCASCNKAFHRLSCVKPAVYDNLEDWNCNECDGNMDRPENKAVVQTIDITLDKPCSIT
jgi:hypothetical protein